MASASHDYDVLLMEGMLWTFLRFTYRIKLSKPYYDYDKKRLPKNPSISTQTRAAEISTIAISAQTEPQSSLDLVKKTNVLHQNIQGLKTNRFNRNANRKTEFSRTVLYCDIFKVVIYIYGYRISILFHFCRKLNMRGGVSTYRCLQVKNELNVTDNKCTYYRHVHRARYTLKPVGSLFLNSKNKL